jgi:hypothetical protein
VIFDRLHAWYWANRYWPMRDTLLKANPEWVALQPIQFDDAPGDRDDEPVDRWVDRLAQLTELEKQILPVDPWPERLWKRREQRIELVGLYEARGRRRDDICGVPRSVVGERAWAAGTRLAAAVAGTVELSRRVGHEHVYEGLSWPEWQDILTDNDDPPTRCVQYASGLISEGCFPGFSAPRRGKVSCLKPRPGSLAHSTDHNDTRADVDDDDGDRR